MANLKPPDEDFVLQSKKLQGAINQLSVSASQAATALEKFGAVMKIVKDKDSLTTAVRAQRVWYRRGRY